MEGEERARLAAFEWLAEQTQVHGDLLPRSLLAAGFTFEGEPIKFVGPQGIFKPAGWQMPLSILTAPEVPGRPRPYDDAFDDDDLLRYRYRGVDPRHPDNVRLRAAMTSGTPLVYLEGVAPGLYYPAWPVYVVGDSPEDLSFVVSEVRARAVGSTITLDPVKGYALRLSRHRLHQVGFRQRVLSAYRQTCAICRLRRGELLDASHILRDGDPRSRPIASHGMLLCKLHHAAFDANVVGVRPDLVVEIREDVLQEVDGPMLVHGLQGFQGARLTVPARPADRPEPAHLEERYEEFRRAV